MTATRTRNARTTTNVAAAVKASPLSKHWDAVDFARLNNEMARLGVDAVVTSNEGWRLKFTAAGETVAVISTPGVVYFPAEFAPAGAIPSETAGWSYTVTSRRVEKTRGAVAVETIGAICGECNTEKTRTGACFC